MVRRAARRAHAPGRGTFDTVGSQLRRKSPTYSCIARSISTMAHTRALFSAPQAKIFLRFRSAAGAAAGAHAHPVSPDDTFGRI